jgi:thiamine-monophosphate kinase
MPSSELERVARLRSTYGAPPPGVRVGIGDDAAVLAPPPGELLVWTVDEQVEGVHFERAWLSFEDIGFRAYMAAASDLAAMGAKPHSALSSLSLPRDLPDEAFDAITRGIAEAAALVGAPVIGGNMTCGPVIALSTTLLGSGTRLLTRSAAQVGETVYMAGSVGLAAAGLRAFLAGTEPSEAARQAFCRPRARVAEGLRAARVASAGVDVSDGLAQDVGHVAAASGVAIVLDADAIVSAALRAASADPVPLALAGGEDYALVVTAPVPIEGFVAIGRVEAGAGVRVRWPDGREEAAVARGFDHYAAR